MFQPTICTISSWQLRQQEYFYAKLSWCVNLISHKPMPKMTNMHTQQPQDCIDVPANLQSNKLYFM